MEQKKFSSRPAIAVSIFVLAVGLTVSSVSAASAATGKAGAPAIAAPAGPAPTVSIAFAQPTVDSGTQPKLAYHGGNLPAGSELFLQLDYGSPAQWDFVKPLNGTAGTATLQSLPAGLYEFRAVAERGITVVAASQAQYLSVVQPSSSSCGVCSILGGVGGGAVGAVVTWLLSLIPW
jgi:hypothetical protein